MSRWILDWSSCCHIRWLWNLNEYGMCLVNNVPTLPGSVIKVCVCVCVRACVECWITA